MTTLNPYINFNGNCREAMQFYQHCLGGELSIQTVKGSVIEDQCPPSMKNKILHATLLNGAVFIMASDMTGPGGFANGSSIAISVNCSSENEINTFYNRFAEGGKILDPLKTQFWGGMFGVVADKFGVRWMFNYNKNEEN
ncbi:VOC family protein [Mucilaginibacter ginsenosidivorans]|uniref:VOC family protein n=1 Tax=Mucilaginibacter ginsenosidivorans TaxID=398053 RepID=A0A5B8V2Z9_9SPHI|nr:VOC family protein [Mucilaginibacter ginsenosidivorans]QEC64926.1 VOC family protein [Mucilaginibacter ginsenosidivorans]